MYSWASPSTEIINTIYKAFTVSWWGVMCFWNASRNSENTNWVILDLQTINYNFSSQQFFRNTTCVYKIKVLYLSFGYFRKFLSLVKVHVLECGICERISCEEWDMKWNCWWLTSKLMSLVQIFSQKNVNDLKTPKNTVLTSEIAGKYP